MIFHQTIIALLLTAVTGIQSFIFWQPRHRVQYHTPEYHHPGYTLYNLKVKTEQAFTWHSNHREQIKQHFNNLISRKDFESLKRVKDRAYMPLIEELQKFREERRVINQNCDSISVRFDEKPMRKLEEKKRACAKMYTDVSQNSELNTKIAKLQEMKDELLKQLDNSGPECTEKYGHDNHAHRMCLVYKIREGKERYLRFDTQAVNLDMELSRESKKIYEESLYCYEELERSVYQTKFYEIIDDCLMGTPEQPSSTTQAPSTEEEFTNQSGAVTVTPTLPHSSTEAPSTEEGNTDQSEATSVTPNLEPSTTQAPSPTEEESTNQSVTTSLTENY